MIELILANWLWKCEIVKLKNCPVLYRVSWECFSLPLDKQWRLIFEAISSPGVSLLNFWGFSRNRRSILLNISQWIKFSIKANCFMLRSLKRMPFNKLFLTAANPLWVEWMTAKEGRDGSRWKLDLFPQHWIPLLSPSHWASNVRKYFFFCCS